MGINARSAEISLGERKKILLLTVRLNRGNSTFWSDSNDDASIKKFLVDIIIARHTKRVIDKTCGHGDSASSRVFFGFLDWNPCPIFLSKVRKFRMNPYFQCALEVEDHLGLQSGSSGLLCLKWEDINLDKREVRIYGSKTKKYRTIPIQNEEFLDHLIERRNFAVIFYVVEYGGNPIKSLKCSFNRAVKLANLS